MKRLRLFCFVLASAALLWSATGCHPIVGGPALANVPPLVQASEPKVDRDITALPVCYGISNALGKNSVAGYFDEDNRVFYIWKGVLIPFALTPLHGVISMHGVLLDLDDVRMKRIKVVRCDPPVRLIQLGKGQVGVACVDRPYATFYRWKGVQFDSKVIAGNDGSAVEILDPKAMKFDVIEIDAPRFAPGGK